MPRNDHRATVSGRTLMIHEAVREAEERSPYQRHLRYFDAK
jgi:hypothetical protein